VILKEISHARTERDGDISAGNNEGYGLYLADTRFLSTFELRINRLKACCCRAMAAPLPTPFNSSTPRCTTPMTSFPPDDLDPANTLSRRRPA